MSDGFGRVKTYENTHTQLKAQAASKKMKLQDYMQYLADMDKDKHDFLFRKVKAKKPIEFSEYLTIKKDEIFTIANYWHNDWIWLKHESILDLLRFSFATEATRKEFYDQFEII